MSEHPLVLVKLNSGDYKGRLKGKVSAVLFKGLRVDRSAMYEIELLDHPTLKTVNVRRNQIVGTIHETGENL
jgi:hypothetical protein